MDLLYFLHRRLEFIRDLYDSTVRVFEGRKRQIDAGEPPYVDHRNPEVVDEPAFLSEWQQADDSIMVIGHWCLCMVQACLQAYLKECISPLGALWWDANALHDELGKKDGKNWFGRYRLLFLDLGVDWSKGPVALSALEQLNLTRDDLMHNVRTMTFDVERAEKHTKRYPVGLFVDDLWSNLGMERLLVDREKLELGIHLVTEFCGWLDDIRCNYPRYAKS